MSEKRVGKFYSEKTVFEEALDRIRFLYDEFPEVVVGFSGGKDSTVTLNLTRIVAEEKGRLPVKVMFIDQEAEWNDAISYIRSVMYSDWVEPYWLQVPFGLFNAASSDADGQWFHVWEEGAEWIRPKDPIAIHENKMGVTRFKDLFGGFLLTYFKDKKVCYLGGLRTDESPTRYLTLTTKPKYKWITYGKKLKGKQHYTFYPIYDWGHRDIWKAIFDNKWEYSELYNKQFQHGIYWQKMRLSSLIHENAVHSLFNVQEFDKELYNAMLRRITGVGTVGKFSSADWYAGTLPFMFGSWREYRDYLWENLINNPKYKAHMRTEFDKLDIEFANSELLDALHQTEIRSIITSDFELSILNQFKLKKYLTQGSQIKNDNIDADVV